LTSLIVLVYNVRHVIEFHPVASRRVASRRAIIKQRPILSEILEEHCCGSFRRHGRSRGAL